MSAWLTIILTAFPAAPSARDRRQRPLAAPAVAREQGPRPARPPTPAAVEGARAFASRRWTAPARSPEIRRAVEGVPGVLGLRFQLGERSLRIAGEPQAALAAVEAIRNTGFEAALGPMPRSRPAPGLDRTTNTSPAAPPAPACRACSLHSPLPGSRGPCLLRARTRSWSRWVGLAVAAIAIAWPDSTPTTRV